MVEILKKSGWMFALAGTLVLGGAMVNGCSGSGTDDDDDDQGDDDASPTDTPTPTAVPVTPAKVTFTVDTTAMADGVNELGKVEDGEQVFMVGWFNKWDPQDPNYELKDDGTGGDATADDGIYTLQIEFPFAAYGTDFGVEYTWNPGDTGFEYKFAKTFVPHDVSGEDADNPWNNSLKDYYSIIDKPCAAADVDDLGGLWQITKDSGTSVINDSSHNFELIPIPDADTTVSYVVDAWETYAKMMYGLPVCD